MKIIKTEIHETIEFEGDIYKRINGSWNILNSTGFKKVCKTTEVGLELIYKRKFIQQVHRHKKRDNKGRFRSK
jgi:hypothetical protein